MDVHNTNTMLFWYRLGFPIRFTKKFNNKRNNFEILILRYEGGKRQIEDETDFVAPIGRDRKLSGLKKVRYRGLLWPVLVNGPSGSRFSRC